MLAPDFLALCCCTCFSPSSRLSTYFAISPISLAVLMVDLINLDALESSIKENNLLMKQTLPPANETVKQREKRLASSKHKKLLEKTAGVNALYMKLNSMSDVLPYCVAFVLANEKTDTLTGYKNSLEISSGTGSKAKHIGAILKHFNIEIDEVVDEIVDLF